MNIQELNEIENTMWFKCNKGKHKGYFTIIANGKITGYLKNGEIFNFDSMTEFKKEYTVDNSQSSNQFVEFMKKLNRFWFG